jgi:hypothetical protein
VLTAVGRFTLSVTEHVVDEVMLDYQLFHSEEGSEISQNAYSEETDEAATQSCV